MSKDAFYFSHDSNARNDLKCMRLRRLCGMAGYGLYWCVIEMLRDASEFRLPLAMREDIVYELRADDSHFAALIDWLARSRRAVVLVGKPLSKNERFHGEARAGAQRWPRFCSAKMLC